MLDKFKGALLGLATGDAVGTTLEFKRPGSFEPINDMVGGGPFMLEAGEWTDDTSMALCLASSLIEKGFAPTDQMVRYIKWRDKGYMSSTGSCFDIGYTTTTALDRFNYKSGAYCGSTNPQDAGNGSLMRLVPIPMYYANDIDEAINRAGDSSRVTHGAETAVDACRYFSSLIVKILNGMDKEEALNDSFEQTLCLEIDEIAKGSYKEKNPPEIKGTGYVVESLEAALWCFYTTDNYRDAILKAANLGDDADTTAAICGQIAGAYYGMDGIPVEWLDKLSMVNEIEEMAFDIFRFRYKL